jgi:PKD repeat protein
VLTDENVTYSIEEAGVFDVALNVSDAAGNSATDVVRVTVRDITPPVADAGGAYIADQETVVFLDGGNSTDNVGVWTWTWTIILEGDDFVISSPTVEYMFVEPGMYEVVLNVSDKAGNTDETSIIVTVMDAMPPRAVAGEDVRIDRHDVVVFNGSGSSDNVGIVQWSWKFEYGGALVTLEGMTVEYRFKDAGSYEVTLTVRDAAGLSDKDTVEVTVDETESPWTSFLWILLILIVVIVASGAGVLIRGGLRQS